MAAPFRKNGKGVWWYRVGVPQRYREAIGKTELVGSLFETNLEKARLKHAQKMVEIRAQFAELDGRTTEQVNDRAAKIVSDGFDVLARSNMTWHAREEQVTFELARAIDNVTYVMLRVLAFRTRLDWGGSYALEAQIDELGEADQDNTAAEFPATGDAFATFAHRDAASVNIALFEKNPKFQGAAFREVARTHLASKNWRAVDFEALIVAEAAGVIIGTGGPLFEAIAQRILRRIVDHRFGHWPAGADIVIQPLMMAMRAHLPVSTEPAAPVATSGANEDWTLTAAFRLWRERRRLAEGEKHKTASEWELVIERFRELCGTEKVGLITKAMVTDFRDDVQLLPSRPTNGVGALPLRQQIEHSRAHGLFTLSPPTVGKHVTCIKSLLGLATEKAWIATNPASGVGVENAKHTGTERDHYSDADMKLIYGSALMTDPDACSDTMFWLLLLAPFQGSRPGELCKLKPREIIKDDGEWVMRFVVDPRSRAPDSSTSAGRPRRQKTTSSVRDIPIHWIVLEAGFLDWVDLQIERGVEWVFDDLVADPYGDRYKYMSRRINDAMRALGIDGERKAFYSTRHSMKREGRRLRIEEHSLDQFTGHASTRVGRKYGGGVPMVTLKGDIDQLEFRSVDWDTVATCAHCRIARLAANIAESKQF